MRLVFFGTPDFAVPTLGALLAQPEFDVLGVVTQPDQPQGRGQKIQPSPIKLLAQQHQLPLWQPQRLRRDLTTQQALQALNADVFVVVAYGQILPPAVLAMPRLGCVNGHGSLLPKYRGAAPIQWALVQGESRTGITIMLMDVGMDTGPMLAQQEVAIDLFISLPELWQKLAELTAELLMETLPKLPKLTPIFQDETQATYAPLIQPANYFLDWHQSALDLHNQVRGFYPNCFGLLRGQRVKILETIPLVPECLPQVQGRFPELKIPEVLPDVAPGTVVALLKKFGLVVATQLGSILLKTVQPPGKRAMSGGDWWHGLRLEMGEKWDIPPQEN
ncbi:methionyl-tRNA formyltransferase [Gloeomargarita lithophora Alchichica-D10]|uniref:Methionyl-tRNA formyltransferase n=1 Tax=Gloeomargarita lithophora Alchichica-D10 TaxID=1188229 RepID=A0A1J0ACT4_9CYAN|nr:methionyl-tRNA formyltransferase [Gloeomargarita lithophora]APB33748.1 methionyl-tRNA formyltransferase [Gloeomargarita lithophora Alchichica-D10]